MRHEHSRQIFEKYSKIKFNENHFSGSPVIRGWTDMKLIIAFRNFANKHKNVTDRSCREYLNIQFKLNILPFMR